MVFDVNVVGSPHIGGWSEGTWWEQHLAPELARDHKGATGAWWIRSGLEVETPRR